MSEQVKSKVTGYYFSVFCSGTRRRESQLGKLLIFAAGLSLSACSGWTQNEVGGVKLEACTDPRPEICTMIYQPVCGHDGAGQTATYASPCDACSHSQVVGFERDECQ